jgi:hypothetical protein
MDLSRRNLSSFVMAQIRYSNVCRCVDILGYLLCRIARCKIILASYETFRMSVCHLMEVSGKLTAMAVLWRCLVHDADWGSGLYERLCPGIMYLMRRLVAGGFNGHSAVCWVTPWSKAGVHGCWWF